MLHENQASRVHVLGSFFCFIWQPLAVAPFPASVVATQAALPMLSDTGAATPCRPRSITGLPRRASPRVSETSESPSHSSTVAVVVCWHEFS